MHKQSKVAMALTAALCAMAFDVIPGVADEQAAKPPVELVGAQRVAPNFVGIDNWLNSAPLNITDLRGKVVLIDFWTYGCYNCVNTLPHVTRLYDTYKDKGFRRRRSYTGVSLREIHWQLASRPQALRHPLSGRAGQ